MEIKPQNQYQIITNTKQKNRLAAKEHYEHILSTELNSFKAQNPIARQRWDEAEFDRYIKLVVGQRVLNNEFHTGLMVDENGRTSFRRKITRKTLIANLSKELNLPELALAYVYDEILDSPAIKTRKDEAKDFVNTSIENSLAEIEISIMNASPGDLAKLMTAKKEMLKLYLESNDAVVRGQTNIVQGNQINNQQNIENQQINKTATAMTMQDLVTKALELRNIQIQP